MKFSEFVGELLEIYRPPLRAKHTWSKMRQVLTEIDTMGVDRVRQLTPGLIARWIHARPDRQPASWNGLLAYLRAACVYATARGYLRRSPFAGVSFHIRDDGPAPKKHHSRADIHRLLDHTADGASDWRGSRLHAMAALFAFTGLRKMEGLTLEWDDVLLEESVLLIGEHRRTKTVASRAPIPIPAALGQVLVDWQAACGASWVIPNVTRTGPWVGGSQGARPIDALAAAGRAVGVDGLTFLSLRHTWATHGESAWGLSEGVIKRVLRHTTPMTQGFYRHADMENLRQAVEGISY
jgi:integrase